MQHEFEFVYWSRNNRCFSELEIGGFGFGFLMFLRLGMCLKKENRFSYDPPLVILAYSIRLKDQGKICCLKFWGQYMIDIHHIIKYSLF